MESRGYTPEQQAELDKLDREEKRWFRRSMISLGLGGVLFLSGIAYSVINIVNPSPTKPEIVQTYNNAQTTLNKLESLREDLSERLNVPYDIPEVRGTLDSVFEREKEQIAQLDRAIMSVREDISEMLQNEEFKDYFKRVNRRNRAIDNGFNFASYTLLLCTLGTLACLSKQTKSYNKRRKLEANYRAGGYLF